MIRAKYRVTEKIERADGAFAAVVTLWVATSPAHDAEGAPRKDSDRWTEVGDVELPVNKAVFAGLEVGKEYGLNFTSAGTPPC